VINKQYASVAEAVADIPDGATVMVGGFGASGSPIELLHALIDHGATDLTVINNNTGNGEVGLAALIGRKFSPSCTEQARSHLRSSPRARSPNAFVRPALASPPSIRQRRLAPCWQRERRFANSMDDHTSWSRGSRQTSR
jgi:3-oxoadipate CoA-transferase alpha subunit